MLHILRRDTLNLGGIRTCCPEISAHILPSEHARARIARVCLRMRPQSTRIAQILKQDLGTATITHPYQRGWKIGLTVFRLLFKDINHRPLIGCACNNNRR